MSNWTRDDKWLKTAKAGDEVIVWPGGVWNYGSVSKIERTTKTLIIVGQDKFRRSNGCRQGSGRASLGEGTTEALREVKDATETRTLRTKMAGVRWRDLDLVTLRAVHAALESEKEQSDDGEVDPS